MEKSVYSIILSDRVVAEIDKVAYSQNMSRSSMINAILADYVSYRTPEKRSTEIFDVLERLLSGGVFRTSLDRSDFSMSFSAPLAYKYRPTVKYSIELKRDPYPAVATLRVSVRSQSSALLREILTFFKAWQLAEQSEWWVEDGKYIKTLKTRDGVRLNEEQLGNELAAYVSALDRAMKIYFEYAGTPDALRAVQRAYIEGIEETNCCII